MGSQWVGVNPGYCQHCLRYCFVGPAGLGRAIIGYPARQVKAAIQQGKPKPQKQLRQAMDVPYAWMFSSSSAVVSVVAVTVPCTCAAWFVLPFPLLACRSPPVVGFDRHQHRHRRVSREEVSGLRLFKLVCKEEPCMNEEQVFHLSWAFWTPAQRT